MSNEYVGNCFCGAVELRATGVPAAMGYCHCASCRSWSASPVNAFTLWDPAAVKITKGAELVGEFSKTPRSVRKWCQACGGHLFTVHPEWGVVDVYAATLPTLPFEAGLHVNYPEAVMRRHDGLLKLKDYPAAMGGSGQEVLE